MTPPLPLVLHGPGVRLEPLAAAHEAGLAASVRDGELWRLWYTRIPAPDAMGEEIARRLALQAKGSMLPFTVVDPATARIVGATSYMNIDTANDRLEIGATWYARSVQRSGLNTQAKLLLLGHAFDALGCIAVEFRTHVLNRASRAAIERLGAKLDGVLRNHLRLADGTLRDTCVYSILQSEWPTVRTHLTALA